MVYERMRPCVVKAMRDGCRTALGTVPRGWFPFPSSNPDDYELAFDNRGRGWQQVPNYSLIEGTS